MTKIYVVSIGTTGQEVYGQLSFAFSPPSAEIMYNSIRISSLQKLIYSFTVCAASAICIHSGNERWAQQSSRRKICVCNGICLAASECMHAWLSGPFAGISHYRWMLPERKHTSWKFQKSHILTAHRWLHECIICRMHWMHSVSSHCRRRTICPFTCEWSPLLLIFPCLEHRQQFACIAVHQTMAKWKLYQSIRTFAKGEQTEQTIIFYHYRCDRRASDEQSNTPTPRSWGRWSVRTHTKSEMPNARSVLKTK